MSKKFYLTTTLPYVNAAPHLGFALEIVHADIVARYHRLLGEEVFFNTGTDEHGVKIYRKAIEEGKDPQAYVDEYAAKFRLLKEKLNLSDDLHFIRTTDSNHKAAAQEFWRRCMANGYIEKGTYKSKYCSGCELEKTDSELEDGKCPIHPNLLIELNEEENYFFKFSDPRIQEYLLKIYHEEKDFVVPEFRLREIESFVKEGLQDFSISRLKSKMPWGVPVPGDEDHVMYVWFDALVNYISTLGWPENKEHFELFWGTEAEPLGIQIAGKDNLRQQSAMWQAMLFAAGLPRSKQIWVHGFITSGGQKMSKSLGNVIDPLQIVEEYGIDALRYWLAAEMNTFEDGDFTMEKFKESYNANLANGLGNLVSRIMKMAIDNQIKPHLPSKDDVIFHSQIGVSDILRPLRDFQIKKVIHDQFAWDQLDFAVGYLNNLIQQKEPFRLIKTHPDEGVKILEALVANLWYLSISLEPFLPDTAKIIQTHIQAGTIPPVLFPRK